MKVTVKTVGKGWKPDGAGEDFKPIYTLITLEHSEPIKTQDPALTIPGEHEAESYTAKSGKTYWRTMGATKAYKPQEKVFKADPDSRASIEKQKALAEAVNFINGLIEPQDSGERIKAVLSTAKSFLGFLNDPESVDNSWVEEQTLETIELPLDTTTEDDLPPTELYEDLIDG